MLGNIKQPRTELCDLIETKTDKIILKINEADSIIESDKFHSELRYWVGYCIKFVLMKN